MQNLPHIPEVLQITSKEIFFDEELADRWYQSLSERKAAIACAIGFYTALKFVDPENPDKAFELTGSYVISFAEVQSLPCISRQHVPV